MHRSYHFENYQQADAFYDRVMEIEKTYFNDKNREFYAPIIDCIVQTNGLKKSLHFVYHFCALKQSELNNCSMSDKLLAKKNKTLDDIKDVNSQLEKPLKSESYLRFRTG